MKTKFLVILFLIANTKTIAQSSIPIQMGIIMIGKTSKPILDLYVVDSTKKNEFKFDEHTIVLFANKNTLKKIYSAFQDEKRYDSLAKYDYSFGTFLFVFRFDNIEKVKVVATRTQSISFFKKIICSLSSFNSSEVIIIKEIDGNLLRRIK